MTKKLPKSITNPKTDQEIRIAMLYALEQNDLITGRRLQHLRHKLIDSDAAREHKLIDNAFKRFWGASPIKPQKHGVGKTSENQDLAGVVVCLCGKGFGDWNDLDEHINKHKGDK